MSPKGRGDGPRVDIYDDLNEMFSFDPPGPIELSHGTRQELMRHGYAAIKKTAMRCLEVNTMIDRRMSEYAKFDHHKYITSNISRKFAEEIIDAGMINELPVRREDLHNIHRHEMVVLDPKQIDIHEFFKKERDE